jgi:UDP-glucose 4-epimerase
MRLLVTGGAGYIGSIVGHHLLTGGHEVVVMDNLSRGHRAGVPEGAELVLVDLLDREALEAAIDRGFDAVLHFAALSLVGESGTRPELYYRTNIGGTLNLLEAMRGADVAQLVFSSTAAVYGAPERVPIPETAPTVPTNTDGHSKLAVDWMIGDFCRAHGLGAVSLRYFNVAGASGGLGEDHDPETHLIPNVLRAALGANPFVEIYGTDYPTRDGTAIRDYIHIDDLAEAHVLALGATEAGRHRVFNLGNGTGFSVREVIAAAGEVTGIDIPTREAARRPGDPPMLVASSALIRDELGWEPRKAGLGADGGRRVGVRPGASQRLSRLTHRCAAVRQQVGELAERRREDVPWRISGVDLPDPRGVLRPQLEVGGDGTVEEVILLAL